MLFHLFTKKRLISLFLFLLAIGVILDIWSSNRLATLGDSLIKIDEAKTKLSLENEILQDEVSQGQSLDRVGQYAKLLGFQPIGDIIYIQTASGSSALSK